jgi:hypothetical protein
VSAHPLEPTHRDIQELLGVYALDAVDPDTASMLELHLGDCVKCSIEVAQHHEVAGLLANSGGAAPARLWDDIARHLDGSTPTWESLAQRLKSNDDRTAPIGGALGDASDSAADEQRPGAHGALVVPLTSERRRGRWLIRAAGIAAAAAALVAVVLGVQVSHLNHQVSALKAPNLLTQGEQSAITDPSTKQIQLTSLRSSRGPTTVGRVTVVLTQFGTGFVEADGLPTLPKTETYQLWGVMEGQTISLGLLGPDPAVVPFSVAGNVPVVAFAITAEHSGGVVQSNNQPVVAGEVVS